MCSQYFTYTTNGSLNYDSQNNIIVSRTLAYQGRLRDVSYFHCHFFFSKIYSYNYDSYKSYNFKYNFCVYN